MLSGFFAILPVLSSWVVWVPACVVLYFQNRLYEALFMAGTPTQVTCDDEATVR